MNNHNDRHIFLIDDEPKVRQVVAATLEQSGLDVSCFENATDCLESLNSQRCDLIVADLRMPGMDGIELIREIKYRSHWTPVLILTGYGDVPTAIKAIKAGAAGFLEKPVDKKSFLRTVKSLLPENGDHERFIGRLTGSEERVLKLVIDAKSTKEIANLLNRSKRTIEVHRAHVMHKLGADSLVDLVKRAAAMGFVDLGAREDTETDPVSANGAEHHNCT